MKMAMSQKEAMDPKEQKKLSKVIESTVIEAINMVDYGMMNGKKVLDQALALIG